MGAECSISRSNLTLQSPAHWLWDLPATKVWESLYPQWKNQPIMNANMQRDLMSIKSTLSQ